MNDTLKIQAMLDSGKREVCLPAGEYEISAPLVIHDNTVFTLADNAVIRLADNAASFMLINDACESEGYNQNITIEGGIWDGNNENQPPKGKQENGKDYFIGHIMRLNGVKDLHIRNVTYKNPTCYAMQILHADRFTVENITFDYNFRNLNMDGVHVQGPAKNGYIRNIKGATNDDLVALNCNDGYTWEEGDITSGDIENIVVDGLFAENGYTGIRLLSCGNPLRNVSISNVFGTYRFYGISFTHHNVIPGAPVLLDNIDIRNVYCSKPPQEDPLDMRPISSIDNAYGQGVHAHAVENNPIIWFAPGVKCGNVSISNLHRTEYAKTYAATIRIDKDAVIDNLALNNITQEFIHAPAQPPVVNRGTVKFAENDLSI